MTEDPSSLFTPRGDSISSDDPPSGPDRSAWRWVKPGADNPTGWRLAGLWALGSLVVVATGLVVAALLGTGPPGMADVIQRMVVLPVGGRDAAEPEPPAVPMPGQQEPTARTGPVVPGQLPPESFPADPGYPVAPGIPLPPALPGDPGTSSGPGSLPVPVPTEPTPPAVPGPITTVEPTAPAGELTPSSEPTDPAGTTTEPTTQAPVEEPPPEDEPPADPPEPPGPGTPDPDDADRPPDAP